MSHVRVVLMRHVMKALGVRAHVSTIYGWPRVMASCQTRINIGEVRSWVFSLQCLAPLMSHVSSRFAEILPDACSQASSVEMRRPHLRLSFDAHELERTAAMRLAIWNSYDENPHTHIHPKMHLKQMHLKMHLYVKVSKWNLLEFFRMYAWSDAVD